MLELMAVLLILSVMTMMAVQAFPILLDRYERQSILEEVITLANDIRNAYANQGNYAGLDNARAIEYTLVPLTMQNGDKQTIQHAKKGNLIISAPEDLPANVTKSTVFEIQITKLSRDNCQFLARHNFSTTLSDILRVGIGTATGTLSYHSGNNLNETLTLETIYQECACNPQDEEIANTCIVSFTFY